MNHPRDIAPADLQAMLARTRYPQELMALVDRAREAIGFFPAHNPRALEYPWVLAHVPGPLRGSRILDVGAGVNPLPFVLADRGAHVVTLDNHTLMRAGSNRSEWNEWGFLDYSALDPRISSVHRAFEEADFAEPFDCILCISVIEHLCASVRRAWMSRFARHLRPGGALLLTVDLVLGTNALWNLSEGNVVEAAGIHGEFGTLIAELEGAAFSIVSTGVEREIKDSRVDVAFVKASRRH
jgi:hypothetical protein